MIETAIDIVNTQISSAWIAQKEGLVFAVEASGEKLPFALGTETCTRENAVTPDSSKTGLIFWEDQGGVRVVDYVDQEPLFSARVRLVGWYNLSQIGIDYTSSPSDARQYRGKAVREIIESIDRVKLTSGTSQATAYFQQQLPKSLDIFSRYTFDEGTGYHFWPYDFFALDFEIRFSQCYEATTTGAAVC